MAKSENKALFEVLKYPYEHPKEEGVVPIGATVDLSHLPIADRIRMVNRGRMKPLSKDALIIPAPEIKKPELPKLNKYGLPFGQVPGAKKENK
jgi:hypothetical protein